MEEPLVSVEDQRFVLFPILKADVWEMVSDSATPVSACVLQCKKQTRSFWTTEEVDLAHDQKVVTPHTEIPRPQLQDWEGMTPNERHFIKHVLAFFVASDGIVGENLVERFLKVYLHPGLSARRTLPRLLGNQVPRDPLLLQLPGETSRPSSPRKISATSTSPFFL